MAITEVFPNPTVKEVAFEIRFPNLFFIESKIGDLQIKIMDKFPQSALVFQRQLLFANLDPSAKLEEIQQKLPQEQGQKVWQFNSPFGYQLNVRGNSISITSKFHKTYNNQQSDNRFRDIISHVLEPFFRLTNLPEVVRVGLRYIDECPFQDKTTELFLSHFNSSFSTPRFPIEDTIEQQYIAVVKRGDYFIKYVEAFNENSSPPSLRLDIDGFAVNVPSAQCLDTTDSLHDLISNEYEATIKDPVYKYMRGDSNNA